MLKKRLANLFMDAPMDSAQKQKGGIAFDPLASDEAPRLPGKAFDPLSQANQQDQSQISDPEMYAQGAAPATPEQQAAPEQAADPIAEIRRLSSKIGMSKAAQASQPQAPSPEAGAPTPGLEGFSPDMDDAALSHALDEKRQLQKQALMARSLGGFGDAAMLSVGKTPTNMNATYDALDEFAKGATDKVEGRRKGMQQNESFKQDKAKTFVAGDEMQQSDPNSDVSVAAREFAKKIGLNPSEKTSYKNLAPLMQEARLKAQFDESVKMRLEQAKERMAQTKERSDLKERQFSDKQTEDDLKATERYSQAARRTEEWKNADKVLASVNSIEELAKDARANGGQSLSMLGPKVAKGIAGEVGVLTEQDVTRYVQDPSMVGSMRDTLLKAKSGKLSQVSYDNLMRLTQIMKKKADEGMRQANLKGAVALSRARPNIELKKAMGMLDPLYDGQGELDTSFGKKGSFPRTVINKSTGQQATVSSPDEAKEAKEHGFE